MEMAGAGDGRRPPALPFGSPEEGAYEADLWTQMNKGFRCGTGQSGCRMNSHDFVIFR